MEFITEFDKKDLEEMIFVAVQRALERVKVPLSQTKEEDSIGIMEASDITKFTVSTIYRKVHDNTIPFKKFGKRLVFSRIDLKNWMEKNTMPVPDKKDVMAERFAMGQKNRVREHRTRK